MLFLPSVLCQNYPWNLPTGNSNVQPQSPPQSIFQAVVESAAASKPVEETVITEDLPQAQGERECIEEADGSDYEGVKRFTASGHECQAWDSQSPNPHRFSDPSMFDELKLSDVRNYCRNPNKTPGGPWCYIKNPQNANGQRWETCGIPKCSDEERIDAQDQPAAGRQLRAAAEYYENWQANNCTGPSCVPVPPAYTEYGCDKGCSHAYTCIKYEIPCTKRPNNKAQFCLPKVDVCKRRVNPGKPCFAGFTQQTKYYYDWSQGKCIPFAYMGCGGNGNAFDTENECLGKCSNWPCFVWMDIGVPGCATGVTKREGVRWAWHPVLKICLDFYYFGCGGNKNHFWSKAECKAICKPRITWSL